MKRLHTVLLFELDSSNVFTRVLYEVDPETSLIVGDTGYRVYLQIEEDAQEIFLVSKLKNIGKHERGLWEKYSSLQEAAKRVVQLYDKSITV